MIAPDAFTRTDALRIGALRIESAERRLFLWQSHRIRNGEEGRAY